MTSETNLFYEEERAENKAAAEALDKVKTIAEMRAALTDLLAFAVEYAGGVHSDIGDPEEWDAVKRARRAVEL